MAKKATAAKKAVAPTATSIGVDEYTDFIFDHGHPEWIVVAAEAPVDALGDAFAALIKTKKRWANVPLRARKKSDDELFPSLVPVVACAGTTWSSVLWVTAWPVDDLETCDIYASKLSRTLKSRAMTFCGEDTSGAMGVGIYKDGKKVEAKDWYQGDPSAGYFKKLGYYLPPCFAMRAGKGMEVVALAASLERITRADVIDIGDKAF